MSHAPRVLQQVVQWQQRPSQHSAVATADEDDDRDSADNDALAGLRSVACIFAAVQVKVVEGFVRVILVKNFTNFCDWLRYGRNFMLSLK